MMKYLKSSKGAVTLFVLVCVMFFFIALVNVQVYLNNKESSVEAQYQKIKESYEKDANVVYSELDI